MGRHALEAPWTAVRPWIAYLASAVAILLSLPVYLAPEPAALPVAAGFTVVGVWLALLGRRMATSSDAWIAVDDGGLTLHAPRALRQDVVLARDEVAEVVVDVEGVAAGADRLRFPVSGALGERRYLHARAGGSTLLQLRSQRGEPNVALRFRTPRRLPVRTVAGRRHAFPGVIVAAADPDALGAALGRTARWAAPPPALAVDVHDVALEGSDARPLTRAERVAGIALAVVGVFGTGLAQRGLETAGAGWSLVAGAVTFAGAFGGLSVLARRARRPA